jgi:hypothetical protein
MDELPRRIQVDKLIPAEKAIYDAVGAVEALPADTRLTKAVMLLQDARNAVADFVDGVNAEPVSTTEAPKPTENLRPTVMTFNEGDWLQIAGKGNVFSTTMPRDFEGVLIGQEVTIKGHNYTVANIEMTGILHRNFLTKGKALGLIINGPRKDQ